jgi:hypothetical protein
MTDAKPPASFFEASPWIRIAGLLRASEFHWYFVEGIKALHYGYYIPSVLSLLAGVEGSIRFTLHRLKCEAFPFEEDLGSVLSNSLLRKGREAGMPVHLLAATGEDEFTNMLELKKPVWLVRVRNDLAHGNVQSFVNRDLGDDNAFFTPECLRRVAQELERISFAWVKGLSEFRAKQVLAGDPNLPTD